jgi:hypothetical protein
MDERNSHYRLESSRNGLTVPVINDVYLHSIYNPVKEAETFAKTHENNLKVKNNILILGLGFGYHVEEVAKLVNSFHQDYNIIILEPNKRLVEDFINTRNFEDKRIKIINTDSVKELFNSWEFVQFLMTKPCIVKHDSSFIIEKDFYSKFLSYQASTDMYHIRSLANEHTKELVAEVEEVSMSSLFDRIQSNGIQSRNDYFLMAYKNLTQNTQGK